MTAGSTAGGLRQQARSDLTWNTRTTTRSSACRGPRQQARSRRPSASSRGQHHPDRNPGDAAAEQPLQGDQRGERRPVRSGQAERCTIELGADWEAYSRAGAAAGAGALVARRVAAGRALRRCGRPFSGFAAGQAAATSATSSTSSDEVGDFSDFFQDLLRRRLGTRRWHRATVRGRGRRATGGPRFEDILAGLGLDRERFGRSRWGGTTRVRCRGARHGRRPGNRARKPSPRSPSTRRITARSG
ncbi:MAG: hypothetical protein WKF78_09390 [Candidatus Limnocylindrales bacterium]